MGAGGADAGIFLVGWFDSTRCKKNCNVWKDKDAMQEELEKQGAMLHDESFKVQPMIIDCSY